jgi:poly(ADP-ribose) glycohydrolase ARH3
VLYEAEQSALPTHCHAIGIDGARLLALAVALALRAGRFDRDAFFSELVAHATTDTFRRQLSIAAALDPDGPLGSLGNSLEADRSVPTSIASFAAEPDSYSAAAARAILLGGDTDTLAAMTCALSGARLGLTGIPMHLLTMLEDGPNGRTYIDEVAITLARLRPHASDSAAAK